MFFILCFSYLLISFALAESASPEVVLFNGQPTTANTWGDWRIEGEGLYLRRAQKVGRWNIWKPEAEGNYIADGVIRAQVKLGKKPDFTLLGRIQLSSDNKDEFDGYGLSIEKKRVSLFRWEGGYVRRLEKSEDISFPSSIEVELWFDGPIITGIVYDATSMEQLVVITTKDSRWTVGEIAYRAHSRQDSKTRLKELSIDNHISNDVSAPLYDIFGTEVLATVGCSELDLIPEDWPVKKLSLKADSGTCEIFLPNRNWISKLQRLGLDFMKTTGSIPYRVIDDKYRKNKEAGLSFTSSGVDLNRSYKDYDMVTKILYAYHRKYPSITRVVSIGKTRRGRKILALRITDNPKEDENEPMLLFNGSHHGSELMSTEFALDAMHTVLSGIKSDPKMASWVRELDMWFVPMVNPDGNDCFWNMDKDLGRKNCWDFDQSGEIELYEGVDLNRNYPFQWGALKEKGSRSWQKSSYYRGQKKGSEPETRAMMRLARKYHPVVVISWHTSGSMILSPYTIDGVDNPSMDVPWDIAESLAKNLPTHPKGRRRKMKVKRKMYSVDGTDQDWHYFTHGSIAYIVEGPIHNPTNKSHYQKSLSFMRPIFTRLVDKVIGGLRISGTVLSKEGEPVPAQIEIMEIKTNSGEKWKARDIDGRFDRMLSKAGIYNLSLSSPGFKPITKRVKVTGVHNIEIIMERSDLRQ